MITYQDFLNAKDKLKFIVSSISTYRRSDPYLVAVDANEYDAQRNVGIKNFTKMFYDITGVAVKDELSANNKIPSNYFHRLNNDRCSYSLGNGIYFSDQENERNDQAKAALGVDFDTYLFDAEYLALIHGVSYLMVTGDTYALFPMTEFVPLPDEEDGRLRAGIRFWSLDWNKRPVYAVLYEEDGYTKYRTKGGKAGLSQLEEIQPKTAYKLTVQTSEAGGEEIIATENYSALPIVPVYASKLHQSTLIGPREKIDAYDMIFSGFANDLQDCAQIYWLIGNAMGMQDDDVAKLRDRLIFQHMAVVDTNNASITPYTQEIPYNARVECLKSIRSQLYEDFAVLDVHTIAAGATNDHIDAGYQPMDEEADRFEFEVIKVVQQIERLKGLEPLIPQFKRNKISNQKEQTEMVMLTAEKLDENTLLNKLPFLTVDEVKTVLENKSREEASRYTEETNEEDNPFGGEQ